MLLALFPDIGMEIKTAREMKTKIKMLIMNS